MSEFEVWLAEKLRDLNTDEGVFLPYILSILEGEEEVRIADECARGGEAPGLLSPLMEPSREPSYSSPRSAVRGLWSRGGEITRAAAK